MNIDVRTTLAAALVVAVAGSATAGPLPCQTLPQFLDCVTLADVRAHQAALQAVANANNGHRVSGSAGYDASKDYIVAQLTGAGYAVSVQPFQFQTFISLSPSVLEQVAPGPTGPIANSILSYSGSGDVTAAVTVPSLSTGCNAADFAGFPAGNIALVERGACTFAIKATNGFNAGASGVVIFNNAAGALNATLSNTFSLNLPVTAVTQAIGQQLAATPGLVLRLKTDTFRGVATSYNVLAETAGGDPEDVVLVGAHLDSVNAGPGIQDNGSGSAAILATALQLTQLTVSKKVRFAWFGAEESGLVGSTYYVNSLAPAELAKIKRMLDFHMIGSPNFVYFILDGDDSDGVGAPAGPAGSAEIEALLASFYAGRGLPHQGTDLSGRSDYAPFMAAGIPAGGLFTGAEGIKTAQEAALWGGVAGLPYDPCYHQACDTFDNVNLTALDVNTDAVAFAVYQSAGVTPQYEVIPALSPAGLAALALLLAGAAVAVLRRV